MMLAFHAKDPSSNPSVVDRVPLSLVTIHPFLASAMLSVGVPVSGSKSLHHVICLLQI